MNPPSPQVSTPTPPSLARLLITLLVAAASAGVVLVTAVLPAEYGIDPVGTGRLLGLTAISDAGTSSAPTAQAPDSGTTLVPRQNGPIAAYGAAFRVDSIELAIDPYQYVEYKYRLEQGATMLFRWNASSPPIYDFHADPDGDPAPDPVSFDKESKSQASGAFVAPFSGIHGWYWENPGGGPMTILLTTAGFYSAATEFRSPRIRRQHPLTPLEQLVFPPAVTGRVDGR